MLDSKTGVLNDNSLYILFFNILAMASSESPVLATPVSYMLLRANICASLLAAYDFLLRVCGHFNNLGTVEAVGIHAYVYRQQPALKTRNHVGALVLKCNIYLGTRYR